VKGEGAIFSTALEGINASYTQGVTDEFIEPISIRKEGEKPVTIGKHDVVICFNFRTDRPREITEALTQRDFPEHGMTALQLHYVSMTNYDARFKDMHVAFEKDHLQNTLGEVLSKLGKTQLRIAETEKYPHVTFFFGGGREEQFSGESRLLVDSPKVATYDLKPEMSALEVKNQVIAQLTKEKPNFICLNFANPDMVGHTGVYDAIKDAIETVDHCLGEVIRVGLDNGYEFLVIADHGNADFAINSDGSPNTAHSLNPVPAILVSKEKGLTLKNGILADVAPTILRRMGIASPIEMTGKSLA
jgi:2,3-bisphosphoglycerate-independent phosphoglycerate mutase